MPRIRLLPPGNKGNGVGILVNPDQVEAQLARGWTLADESDPAPKPAKKPVKGAGKVKAKTTTSKAE